MKLITFKTRHEGESMADAFIAFGRKIDGKDDKKRYNGFYLLIQSPFTKVRTVLDIAKYEEITVPTRRSVYVMVRRIKGEGPWVWMKSTSFVPA